MRKATMRIFVTGATGWIGTATVNALQRSGHDVFGLARSKESAAKLTSKGAEMIFGDLDGADSLGRAAVARKKGVSGYIGDGSAM
jgi:uncharacterized protein YbjT (DUF2867 family)